MSRIAERAVDDALARCADGDRSAFSEIVREHLAGKTVRKVVYVPRKLVSIVAG